MSRHFHMGHPVLQTIEYQNYTLLTHKGELTDFVFYIFSFYCTNSRLVNSSSGAIFGVLVGIMRTLYINNLWKFCILYAFFRCFCIFIALSNLEIRLFAFARFYIWLGRQLLVRLFRGVGSILIFIRERGWEGGEVPRQH